MPRKRNSGDGGFDETGPAPLLRFFPFMPDRSWYEKTWLEGADDRHRAQRVMRLVGALGERLAAAARGLLARSQEAREAAAATAPAGSHGRSEEQSAARLRGAA